MIIFRVKYENYRLLWLEDISSEALTNNEHIADIFHESSEYINITLSPLLLESSHTHTHTHTRVRTFFCLEGPVSVTSLEASLCSWDISEECSVLSWVMKSVRVEQK